MFKFITVLGVICFISTAGADTLTLKKDTVLIDMYELHELESQLHEREVQLQDKFNLERSTFGHFDKFEKKNVQLPSPTGNKYEELRKKKIAPQANVDEKKTKDVLAEYIKETKVPQQDSKRNPTSKPNLEEL